MEEETSNNLEAGSGTTYMSEIDKIETSDQPPERKIELLDILFRDYLRKRYHLKKNTEYDEMIDFFMQKNKPYIASICHEMVLGLYSGGVINMNNITVIIEDIRSMIEKEEGSEKGIGVQVKKAFVPLLNRFKKKSEPKKKKAANTENVGKQAKKAIDKYLESSKVMEEIKKDSTAGKAQEYEINPAFMSNQEEEEESPEMKSVSNIDDLERIKHKIKQRKIIAKDKKDEK